MSNLSPWVVVLAVVAIAILAVTGLKGAGPALQPAVWEAHQLAAQSQELEEGVHVAPVAHTRTGEVLWAQFENVSIPMHYHGQTEIAYVLQGQFTMGLADGTSTTAKAGQLIVIPARTAVSVSGTGDVLIFVTPPENERDTVWLAGPMAKRGAKADPTRKPQIIDASQRIARGLDQERAGFRFTVAFEAKSGSVEFLRIEQSVATHKHPKENHVLYILKGRGRGQIGDKTTEVGPGQIVVLPANVPHRLERIGNEPLDFILFSTPGFHAGDIVWLKEPEHMEHHTTEMTPPTKMVPAPAQGFALHIDAKKHINGMPDFVVHHYCKTLDKNYIQCLLFDSDAPNAHVIGVETIISPEVYAQLPEEERADWHYHKDEIPLVDAQLPGLSEAEIAKVVAAIEDTYGRIVIFWTPGAVAPMGTPSVTELQSHRDGALREILIRATDFSFDVLEQIEGGLVTVTMENDGSELHHLQLARLREGVTLDQVQKILAEGPEAALFPLLEWVGGPSLVAPGGRSQVVLNLPEGQYLLLCFVPSSDGVPHLAKGMMSSLNVVASSYRAEEPKADVTATLTDFAFTMPSQIKAGPQIWKIVNKGQQLHEMPVVKLAPGKTLQDLLASLQSPEGMLSLDWVGGMQAIDGGKTGWAVLDLELGNYAVLCFVPDPTSGKPHIELGMIATFTVK